MGCILAFTHIEEGSKIKNWKRRQEHCLTFEVIDGLSGALIQSHQDVIKYLLGG